MDLDEENEACLREFLTDTDVAGIAAATLPEASPASAAMVEEFQGKLFTCLAGLLLPNDGGPAASSPPPDDSSHWQYSTGNPGGLVIVSPSVADGGCTPDARTGEPIWSIAIGYHWWCYPYAVSAGVVYVGYQNADSGGIHSLLTPGNSNRR